MKTGLITSNTYRNHNTGDGHPEKIDRVTAIIDNLKKLNDFLINKYQKHASKKCGLHQYKDGKKGYKFICKINTLKELTPEKLFKFGMDEMKRIKKEVKVIQGYFIQ